MRGIKYTVAITILLFLALKCYAQTDSIFWFAAPEVSNVGSANTDDRPILVKIATFNKSANVKISQPANSSFTPISVSVSANSVYTFNLTSYITSIENTPGDKVQNFGLLIESSTPVTAYYEVATSCDCNSEIYNLKGRNALGRDFFIPSQTTYNNALRAAFSAIPPYSSFNIVATQDSTKVIINPTQDIVGHTAGTAFTIKLNKGQSYAAIAKSQYASGHLEGSRVISNKPIAITISDDLLEINPHADLAGDQIVPVDVLGKEYVVVKGMATTEYTYVTATKDNTQVYYDGTLTTTLKKGDTYSKQLTSGSTYITSNNPIYVLHLSGVDQEISEALVPPANCVGSQKVNFVRTSSEPFGLVIFTEKGNESHFTLNGSSTAISSSSFSNVPGTSGAWVYASLSSLTTSTVPVGYNSISNSNGLFHLGTINGQNDYAAEYGYFSNYSNLYLGSNIQDCSLDSVILDAGAGKDSYLWSDSSISQFLKVKQSGRYSVTTKANGCTLYDTINVLIGNTKINLGKDTTICDGASIVLTPGLNTDSTKYVWQNGSINSSIKVSKAGKYFVRVTTPCGILSDTINVKVSYPPTISLGNDTSICINDSFLLVPQASDTSSIYTWQDGSHKKEFWVSHSGIYYLSINNGCGISNDTINIGTSYPPVVSLGNDTTLCGNSSFTLVPKVSDTSATYTWQDGSHGRTYNVKNGGIYWLSLKNKCGVRSDTIVVSHSDIPVVDLGKDTSICASDSLILVPKVNDTAGLYTWSNGSHNKSLTIKTAGTYRLTVKTYCGISSDSINIGTSYPPIVNLGSDTTLCGSSFFVLTPKVNDTAAIFTWQDGSHGRTYNVKAEGVYWLSLKNKCGVRSDTLLVSKSDIPVVDLGKDTLICASDSFVLVPKVSDTTVLYTWNDGSHGKTLTIKSAGRYDLTVKNYCGEMTDSIVIKPSKPPVVSLGSDRTVCEGDTVLLIPSLSDTSATLSWQNGSKAKKLKVTETGTYYVKATNSCGSSTDTVNITVTPKPHINFGVSTRYVCTGDSIVLRPLLSDTTAELIWSNGSTAKSITVKRGGVYWAKSKNSCGTDSSSIRVVQTGIPTLNLKDTVVCFDSTFHISFNQGIASYKWSTGDSLPNITIKKNGRYWVEASNFCGKVSDTFNVTFGPLANFRMPGSVNFCKGDSVLLNAYTPGATYLWQDGSTDSVYMVRKAGKYRVSVTKQGCMLVDTVVANQFSPPIVSLGNDTTICGNDSIIYALGDFGAGTKIKWQDSSFSNIYAVKRPGKYFVSLSNSCGASSDTVIVSDCDCKFFIPSAFTPNIDTLNEVFIPKGCTSIISTYKFTIYNRWGEQLFETGDVNTGWNGKFHNEFCPTGVYVYIIRYKDIYGKETKLKGTFLRL